VKQAYTKEKKKKIDGNGGEFAEEIVKSKRKDSAR